MLTHIKIGKQKEQLTSNASNWMQHRSSVYTEQCESKNKRSSRGKVSEVSSRRADTVVEDTEEL